MVEQIVKTLTIVVQLCFVKKKSIVVAQASEKGFNTMKEITLDGLTISLAIESGLCCVALSTGKYVFVDTMAQRKSVQDLCEFDPKDVLPKVVHVGKVSIVQMLILIDIVRNTCDFHTTTCLAGRVSCHWTRRLRSLCHFSWYFRKTSDNMV